MRTYNVWVHKNGAVVIAQWSNGFSSPIIFKVLKDPMKKYTDGKYSGLYDYASFSKNIEVKTIKEGVEVGMLEIL